MKEITPSEGYLLDEEEHDVVCDYEGDLVAEVSRSTTSAEQVIKQPFQLIKVSDNGDDTEAGLLAGAEFAAYLKSSLSVSFKRKKMYRRFLWIKQARMYRIEHLDVILA